MTEPDRPIKYPAKYAERPFRHVLTDFTLDGARLPKKSGYRPHWHFTSSDGEPLLVGMCNVTLVGTEWIQPGETRRAEWEFVPSVQGYIEELVKAGDEVEITEGLRRVGCVTVVEFVF